MPRKKKVPFPGSSLVLTACLVGSALVLPEPLYPHAPLATDQALPAQSSSFIQGKLDVAPNGPVKIAGSTGAVAVTSDNPSLLHTLQDSRLGGREVRLEGDRKPDGSLNVRHLFTVHDGKLFRVRYFCHVCNIPATEPGNCVCCQRPTELEEIPADQVTDDMVMVP